MTENYGSFWFTVPFCEVATADAARHDFKEKFILADRWFRHFHDSNILVAVVDSCERRVSPKE